MKMAITGAGLALFIEGLGSAQLRGEFSAGCRPSADPRHQAAGDDGGGLCGDHPRPPGQRAPDVIVDYAAHLPLQLAATIANVVVVATGAMPRTPSGVSVCGVCLFPTTAEAQYVVHSAEPGGQRHRLLRRADRRDPSTPRPSSAAGGQLGGSSPSAPGHRRTPARQPLLAAAHDALAGIVSRNMSGWATNVSLGLMLGMTQCSARFRPAARCAP